MNITTEAVKELRDRTGVSVMQCKKALEEAGGDMEKAILILKKKSAAVAAKKGDRALGAGAIATYVHGAEVGAMVLLSCETDFVAKNEEFKALAYTIAMQIAATAPEFGSREGIDEATKNAVREMLQKDVEGMQKDETMKEKVLSGKIDSYFKDKILLEQPYIKDESFTVRDLIDTAVQKFGERIEVSRFARFSVR